jgi:hypothetical protein
VHVAGQRAAEILGHQHGEHAVAERVQEVERDPVVAGERGDIEVERTHVVDPHVEAADVEARARIGPRRERGQLARDHVGRLRPVLRIARVGQPEPARGPQRPRLQGDPPLQLAAAVGDRVAEGQDAESHGAGG